MKGVASYKNWKAALSEEPWYTVSEYFLFTDAHIVGDRVELGPYHLINMVAFDFESPNFTLRIYNHLSEENDGSILETQEEHYHGGFEADELAALLSLCMGIRLRASGPSRIFDKKSDPLGTPLNSFLAVPDLRYIQPRQQKLYPNNKRVLPNALGQHSIEDAKYLSLFPLLSSQDATCLVKAARMYQEAVWVAEVNPELSWLMLITCVETLANRWRENKLTPVESLSASEFGRNLIAILRRYSTEHTEELISEVAENIANLTGATKKFTDFIMEFLPDPPFRRPEVFAQFPWKKSKMKDAIRQIYDYRSRALHSGQPFPAPMCEPVVSSSINIMESIFSKNIPEEIPTGLATSMKGGTWVAKDLPMYFHTFEYISRNAILKWWQSAASRR